jgi:hypothetical protein
MRARRWRTRRWECSSLPGSVLACWCSLVLGNAEFLSISAPTESSFVASDALEWVVVRIDDDQGETETRMTEVYSSIWDGFSVQNMRIEGVALDEKRIGMVVSY